MKKDYEKILLVGLLVLLIAGFSYIASGDAVSSERKDNSDGKAAIFTAKSSDGAVSVELTPRIFDEGKLYVDFSINTHTVEMGDYNLRELVTLIADNKEYKPSNSPVMKGHHNKGELIFETGKEFISFKIIVKGIPDKYERVFNWP